MELCSKKHDEICYDGRACPFCEVIAEKEELAEKVKELEEELSNQ